jgi:hypothetical protein
MLHHLWNFAGSFYFKATLKIAEFDHNRPTPAHFVDAMIFGEQSPRRGKT